MSESTGPALVVTRHGGIDVLAIEDRPAPRPAAGEVIVEVAAAGVNFIDVYQREGIYPASTPFVGGNEGFRKAVGTFGEGAKRLPPFELVQGGHLIADPAAAAQLEDRR